MELGNYKFENTSCTKLDIKSFTKNEYALSFDWNNPRIYITNTD